MINAALASVLVLTGMATVYTADQHADLPLYCDRGHGWTYAETTTPWVALDVRHYHTGAVRCGDLVMLRFPGGQVLTARALDAGNLERYHVQDHGPIVADIPEHLAPFDGLSAPVILVNRSALARAFERIAGR